MAPEGIRVRVTPRAKADEIVGVRDGRLLIRVTAPPLDGRANEAVCALIARGLGARRREVAVVQGLRSRDKVVRVEGIAPEELMDALAPRPQER